jgi:hypothetical protein
MGEQEGLMARIRSVHPGLFTDEAFAALSMAARVLLLGIWTESDDHGVFEWKPITLKMRILPVDNADVGALLDELVTIDVVKKFEIGGKSFGLVRNFCKYQRPKKPNYKFVLPDELRTYSGVSDDGAEPVPYQFGTGGEIPPQMEEEGGKRKEEIEDSHTVAVATSEHFEEFWKNYPRRDGPNPRAPAERKFNSLVKTGLDPEMLIEAVKKLARDESAKGNIGTRFIPQAMTWLSQQRWSDHAAIAFLTQDDCGKEFKIEEAVKMFAKNRHWSRFAGPEPGMSGCRASPELLAEFGLKPDGRPFERAEMAS